MTLNSDPTVTISLDLFTVSLLLGSILFTFCLILAIRKYFFLRRASGPLLDTKKLLILSAATACFLRIMSFVGVIAMDIANVRAHYSLKPVSSHSDEHATNLPTDENQSFYDSAMTVLFDLPNAVVISTYVLLTLVWAECCLLSRLHTESSVRWRKKWLVWYTIFNSGLYATQIVLYLLIFAGGSADSVAVLRNIVNVAMSGINLSAVFLVFVLYVYLSVKFSGYPYRSQNAKESLRKISNVMLLWSLTRIVWGISMLVIYIRDVDLLRPSQGGWAPIIFLLLLILCEIAPIIILMDYSFMTIFEFNNASTRDMSSAVPQRSESFVMQETSGDKSSLSAAEEPLLGGIS